MGGDCGGSGDDDDDGGGGGTWISYVAPSLPLSITRIPLLSTTTTVSFGLSEEH